MASDNPYQPPYPVPEFADENGAEIKEGMTVYSMEFEEEATASDFSTDDGTWDRFYPRSILLTFKDGTQERITPKKHAPWTYDDVRFDVRRLLMVT